jgi:hypothetical protein
VCCTAADIVAVVMQRRITRRHFIGIGFAPGFSANAQYTPEIPKQKADDGAENDRAEVE